ncbi:MAG: hypothetical protein ABR555_12585 [Pyrinomonadaceae bacterium]
MLLALLFLIGSAILGVCLVRRLFHSALDGLEQLCGGVVVGWILSITAVYLLARLQARLSRPVVLWTTSVIWLVTVPIFIHTLRQHWTVPFRWKPNFAGALLLVALFSPIYWSLFASHFFPQGPGGLYSGGSAYADMSFHAALSTSFLYGENFPPAYTPRAGEPLLYPLLPDFQTAVLMQAGLTMRNALLLTSMTLATVATVLIFAFALRVARNQIAAILATILFQLNGGLGFVDLIRDWWQSGKSFLQFWSTLQLNYAHLPARGLHWPNIIADSFVPQRTSLFGFPITLLILILFAIVWQKLHAKEANENGTGNFFLFAGVLAGFLPYFHVHAYMAVVFLSVVLFLLRPRRSWLMFWIPAVLLAAPLFPNLLKHAASGSFVRFQLGWMGAAEANFPWFLLRNFGLPLLLAVPALFVVEQRWRKFYAAFLLLLIFSFTVVVSPNIFDNVKLMYFWHAMNSVLVASFLTKVSFHYKQAFVATVCALLCVVTGVAALQHERLNHSLLFSNEEIAAANFAIEQTDPKALFLTAPVSNQPILCLAGRPVLRGPTVWPWSHGYEFRDREADIRRIYSGSSDVFDLLRYYGVNYIYLGAAEKDQFHADPNYFTGHFRVAFQAASLTIFDVRDVLTNTSSNVTRRDLAARIDYDPFALLVHFPETSFYVYRLWLVSHARPPRLSEFLTSMRVLGAGLFPEAADWKSQLARNEADLVAELTGAPEFSASHERESDTEFTNQLLKNAGLPLNDSFAVAIRNKITSRSESRTTALQKIVATKELYGREYNKAYVLVHYFGYLGRNPDDPPDSNYLGFEYWKKILDDSGDYRSLSRAFLESHEYSKL